MKWIKFKEEKPPGFKSVLVKTNMHDDDWRDYFVSEYFQRDNEWIMNIHFQAEEPHIRISRKILEDDEWCEIL